MQTTELDQECILTSCHEPGAGIIWCERGDSGVVCAGHIPEVQRHGYIVREGRSSDD